MIPTLTNPMGFNPEWKSLLDANTEFLIWGNLIDRTGNVQIENHGLIYNEQWISSPDTTSYAVIPANSLPTDVLCTDHDWSLECRFFIPTNWMTGLSRRVGLFGCMAGGSTSWRMDLLFLLSASYFTTIGGMAILANDPVLDRANLFTINFKAGTGFSFKLNGVENPPATVQDITTPRNSRTQNFGILANTNVNSIDSYAYMMRINYIRISNVTR